MNFWVDDVKTIEGIDNRLWAIFDYIVQYEFPKKTRHGIRFDLDNALGIRFTKDTYVVFPVITDHPFVVTEWWKSGIGATHDTFVQMFYHFDSSAERENIIYLLSLGFYVSLFIQQAIDDRTLCALAAKKIMQLPKYESRKFYISSICVDTHTEHVVSALNMHQELFTNRLFAESYDYQPLKSSYELRLTSSVLLTKRFRGNKTTSDMLEFFKNQKILAES